MLEDLVFGPLAARPSAGASAPRLAELASCPEGAHALATGRPGKAYQVFEPRLEVSNRSCLLPIVMRRQGVDSKWRK